MAIAKKIVGKGTKKIIQRLEFPKPKVRPFGEKKIKITAKEAKANKRGLKAANKPTNKVGSKADKELRASTKSVQASNEQTKAQYDYYYGKGAGDDVTIINKSVTPKNEARSVRTLKPKPRKPRKR